MDELYPNIDTEMIPDLEELQKEKDDIIKEVNEEIKKHGIIILKDKNRIIGVYSPYLNRSLLRINNDNTSRKFIEK